MDDHERNNKCGAEATAAENDSGKRNERLGVRAFETKGRPTLDCRWDTLVYEEGLRSDLAGDRLGSPRLAIREESERLIAVAKRVGDYIPPDVWKTFGLRVMKRSGESVVLTDEANGRVIKIKDPFAYIPLKNDNPYQVLYEHHIHNHFFGDVSYRLLGISQDPITDGVRFVFEQPFVGYTEEKPSKREIQAWFAERGFELSKDGYWFSDGYVSFTDVWGDNCLKDERGDLHFIDPIIRFERKPKEVLSHYIEQSRVLKNGQE